MSSANEFDKTTFYSALRKPLLILKKDQSSLMCLDLFPKSESETKISKCH